MPAARRRPRRSATPAAVAPAAPPAAPPVPLVVSYPGYRVQFSDHERWARDEETLWLQDDVGNARFTLQTQVHDRPDGLPRVALIFEHVYTGEASQSRSGELRFDVPGGTAGLQSLIDLIARGMTRAAQLGDFRPMSLRLDSATGGNGGHSE